MTTASTNKGTRTDPKQLLDEEIDEAFAAEEVVITEPKSPSFEILRDRIPLRRLLAMAAVAASVSLAATVTSQILARRKWTLSRALVRRTAFRRAASRRAKGGRRIGYERYRFGRFGQAVVAYTYKVPDVHVQLPQLTYKIPSIRVKLPSAWR